MKNEIKKLLGIILKKTRGGGGEAYVDEKIDEAIDALVDGAPEALDTLKELADAIIELNKGTKKETTIPQNGFVANIFYSLGEISQDTTFVLVAPEDNTFLNEYLIQFSIGNTVPTITFPNGLSWLNGETPTLNANKTYQLSIVDNLAILAEF